MMNDSFLKIFHNSLVGMILTDDHHIITHVNDHLLQLTELDRQEVIGKTGLELGLLNKAFVKAIWEEIEEKEKLLNRELEVKTKSSKIIHCLFSTEKIELNNTVYWLTTLIDISERKKTEKKLSEVYERVTDGFIAIDHNWCYSYVNKKAGELLGKDPAYLIGKHVWTEFPQEDDNPFYLSYLQAMERQEMRIVEEYSRPHNRWFQNLIYPSPDGLSIFLTDITASKKVQLEIAESELRFRTLTRAAPVGIFETDAAGSTTFVNETWLQYSGLTFEEALGAGWLQAVHPGDREWLAKGWQGKTQVQAESYSEYRIVDKNGRQRWVNGKAVPFKNTDGKIKGYIGIILDVTERKKAESKQQESSEQLRKLTRHLQDIREEERMKIAREIHDELGQQLTGLKMDIAWLMKKTGQDNPVIKAKFHDTLMLIDATVKSIRRIATELRPSIIDDLGLNAAIDWQISEFRERLDIEIEYENEFNDKNIPSDISIGLFRIIQESLTNIAKHAGAKKLNIKIEQLDNAVKLMVQDDGVGFDIQAKQTDLSFGLLGIKERTGMMQGACVILSKPGAGTIITITIPLGKT